jgi:hypothetical protein
LLIEGLRGSVGERRTVPQRSTLRNTGPKRQSLLSSQALSARMGKVSARLPRATPMLIPFLTTSPLLRRTRSRSPSAVKAMCSRVIANYRAGLGHLELSAALDVGSHGRIGELRQVHPGRLYSSLRRLQPR